MSREKGSGLMFTNKTVVCIDTIVPLVQRFEKFHYGGGESVDFYEKVEDGLNLPRLQ